MERGHNRLVPAAVMGGTTRRIPLMLLPPGYWPARPGKGARWGRVHCRGGSARRTLGHADWRYWSLESLSVPTVTCCSTCKDALPPIFKREAYMEATAPGPNRTGAALVQNEVNLMLEAVRDLSPPIPISTLQIDVERQSYIVEADSVGSIPPPKSSLKSAAAKGSAKTKGAGANAEVFLDKLGERIAFERTGTRLYDALITKYLALHNAGGEVLPPTDGTGEAVEETALQTLQRIRAEELGHFRMLCESVVKLGGDPTAQTPCADVAAAASSGLIQVITDPRTTLAQCLNTILTAELTDNAGWELLGQLAQEAGHNELGVPFSQALEAEQRHLVIIRDWLKLLLTTEAGTAAV